MTISTLKCWGDFGGEPRGSTPKSIFPHYLAHVAMSSLRLETAIYPLAPRTSALWYSVSTSMAAFTSTIAINAEQLANSPQLEPSFEHLLRNSNVHESIISTTLRINAVTDRDTFVSVSKMVRRTSASIIFNLIHV